MHFNVLFTTLLTAAAASAASLPKRQSVSVDVNAINAAVQALNDASNNLRGLEGGLESQLQGLSEIQGVSDQLSQAQGKVGEVIQVWDSLASSLQSAASSYQDADQNTSNLFG